MPRRDAVTTRRKRTEGCFFKFFPILPLPAPSTPGRRFRFFPFRFRYQLPHHHALSGKHVVVNIVKLCARARY